MNIDKKKCSYNECNHRIKLTNLPCKCGNIYCIEHRLPEKHNCTFDYKNEKSRRQLIEDMECKSLKIQKI